MKKYFLFTTIVCLFSLISCMTLTNVENQYVINTGLNTVEIIRFSPDGKYIAVDSGSNVLLFDSSTYAKVGKINTGLDTVHVIQFSPDGRYIAVDSSSNIIFFTISEYLIL